ncbi:MAG: hypothetical protein GC131_06190 [Alphaproteobacteria bacterium]|nr:hypothetical protein [Alphaproteobacteria bacterium]
MIELVLRSLLDITLIGLIVAGIFYAIRVERHLSGIRASRAEMERFVHDFGSTVNRAEAGIKGLKEVARDSGDDLERLIERSQTMRDELRFVVEHADKLAERISSMSVQMRQPAQNPIAAAQPQPARATSGAAGAGGTAAAQTGEDLAETSMEDAHVKSRAERELMQALRKLRS